MSKRFTVIDNHFKYLETGIKDNQSYYSQLNGETVVELLNMLHEENTNLKFELDLCKNPLYSRRELEKENEQLKQQNEALSEFEHKVFDLINEKINEMQTEYDTDSMESPSWYTGLQYGIETFKELKEELKP